MSRAPQPASPGPAPPSRSPVPPTLPRPPRVGPLARLRAGLARFVAFVRRDPLDRDLDQELASHLELAMDDHRRRGMSEEQARRQAAIAFGSVEAAKEQHRDARGLPHLEVLLQDLRHAVRTLRRDAGFSLIAILILGIGIGANTAVFSLVNAILFRPLPFAAPSRLVWMSNNLDERFAALAATASSSAALSFTTSRVAIMEQWQARSRTFESISAYDAFFAYGSHKLNSGGAPMRLVGVIVAQDFFTMLGLQPRMGRWFTREECVKNGPPAIIISHALWQRRFNSDPTLAGRSVLLDGKTTTVVGVLPEEFDFGSIFAPGIRVDLFSPMVMDEIRTWGNTLSVVGRLKPGASLEAAKADIAGVNAQLEAEGSKWGDGYGARLSALQDYVNGRTRPALMLIWAAVGVVLLMVCANLSSLLLTRASSRQREFAVRAALGAGRGRLLRQLLTESLVLASCGALLGLAAAWLTVRYVASAQGMGIPLLQRATIDGWTLAFTAASAILVSVLVGLAPGMQAASARLLDALKDGARGSTGGRQAWVRSALVVLETSLACMLLVAAGLLLRSFLRVLDVNLGFEPAHAIAIKIDEGEEVGVRKDRVAFLNDVATRVAALPGVAGAGVTDTLPLDRNRSWGIGAKGVTYPREAPPIAFVSRVGPGFFKAMGIRLRTGRDFTALDEKDRERVVIINETVARTLYPDREALDQTLLVNDNSRDPLRIVAITADVRNGSVERRAGMEIYLPVAQWGGSTLDLIVRTHVPVANVIPSVRDTLRTIDPTLPVDDVRPLGYLVDRALSPRKFFVTLLAGFAAAALLLASLGLYGVIAWTVNQRTTEIGIRMALGASPGDVSRRVIGQTLTLALAGIAAGAIGAFAISRLMTSLVFDISTTDLVTFLATPALLACVALVAGYLPARRASRIDPVSLLRAS